MNVLQRWNYERHEYEPHFIPDEWEVSLYETDMSKIVNCARCGEAVVYEDTFSSREIHNFLGMGYAVCERCYREEFQRRVKAGGVE